ncbi:MAG TPA: glycosyltransferase, partial [Ilumatobacteraceae bacterium]
MRVSVVICTYNRADGLRDTLRSLQLQRHGDFEVVVVDGPSTDHTESVLSEFGTTIKVVHNAAANLSISRNLGIRAASGELVAFIDDDALPEPSWLEQILPAFADDEVAGTGGIVLDHTGMRLQYRYSASNRFGESTYADDEPFDAFCTPGAFTFPYLQGTNAVFRRDALARIGVFDETFDFYLDETDVCCRLVDAGFVLRQLADAPIHHKYLPSATRNADRVVTNWYPIVKNHVYFGYRHASDVANELEIIERARTFVDKLLDDTRLHERQGRLAPGHLERAKEACGRGLATGIVLGRERRDARLRPVALDPGEFVPFPTTSNNSARRIVLVSSGYPPALTGGIARFISDVAPELAAMGHEVRVFAKSAGTSTVDLEDGVWVHRLEPAPS